MFTYGLLHVQHGAQTGNLQEQMEGLAMMACEMPIEPQPQQSQDVEEKAPKPCHHEEDRSSDQDQSWGDAISNLVLTTAEEYINGRDAQSLRIFLDVTKNGSFSEIMKSAKSFPASHLPFQTWDRKGESPFTNILKNNQLNTQQKMTLIYYLIDEKNEKQLYMQSILADKACLSILLSDLAFDGLFNLVIDAYHQSYLIWDAIIENGRYDWINIVIKASLILIETETCDSRLRFAEHWINKHCNTEIKTIKAFRFIENAINQHLKDHCHDITFKQLEKSLNNCKSYLLKLAKQQILKIEIERRALPSQDELNEITPFLRQRRHEDNWLSLMFRPKIPSVNIHEKLIGNNRVKAINEWTKENEKIQKKFP